MTAKVSYGLLGPYEASMIQAMMQGSGASSLNFNLHNQTLFVARIQNRPIGFVCGQKGYGNSSHILMVTQSYFHPAYERTSYQRDMEQAFVHWAQTRFGVTHVQRKKDGQARPIDAFCHDTRKAPDFLPLRRDTTPDFQEELIPA